MYTPAAAAAAAACAPVLLLLQLKADSEDLTEMFPGKHWGSCFSKSLRYGACLGLVNVSKCCEAVCVYVCVCVNAFLSTNLAAAASYTMPLHAGVLVWALVGGAHGKCCSCVILRIVEATE